MPEATQADADDAVEAVLDAESEIESESDGAAVMADKPLAGTSWNLAFFGMSDSPLEPLAGTTLTVHYLLDEFTGTGGCNWFVGAYSTKDQTIMPVDPNVTRVQCVDPEGIMDQESTFIGSLANATAFEMEGENLVLFTVGDQRLVTMEPAQPTQVEGTNWSLRFLSDGSDWGALEEGTEITLLLDGGQASGSAGCNSYTADVAMNGSELAITNVAATEKTCADPAGVMAQESVFLSALSSVGSLSQLSDALTLQDDQNEPQLLFSAQ